MKKLLLIISIVFVVYHATICSAVYGQTKKDEITVEEKKAANELADRFVKRLNETGDVEPLIKEMFVSDFMNRYVREELEQKKSEKGSSAKILFASGLEYDPRLLKEATEDDWRSLYVNTFNFMNYGLAFMVNAGFKSKASGKEMDDDEMEKIMGKMYPSSVMTLLNSNLMLRNMFRKGNDARPIKDVDELREANKVLAKVNRILIGKPEGKLTAEAQAAFKRALEKMGDLSTPNVGMCDRECYGFERGTRIIALFATPMHALFIAKVGADYKIISARVSSPD